jgi:hypothetical protein
VTERGKHWSTRGITWRITRWAALGAGAAALWACNVNRPVTPVPKLSRGTNDIYQIEINRDIDIVFMIDDSSSMTPLQNKLAANFPVFMNVLKGLPRGLPNVHIGVVSSSMGAGRNPTVDHCPQGGDRGVFHAAPLGATCPKGSLNPGQSFISNVNGVINYTGDIADVFSCIAPLGDGGCGFEHQFASVLRALGADGQPPPPENAGFLRPNAYLMVILITNEDDCSAPPDSALFDSSSTLVSDALGPLQSYRCNEFGHACGGHAPPRTPAGPTDLTGTCTSAEDGPLVRVADVVAALKKLKADPSKVIVSAIAGPPDPYVVDVVPSEPPDVSMWPVIDHSCDPGRAPRCVHGSSRRTRWSLQGWRWDLGPLEQALVSRFQAGGVDDARGNVCGAFDHRVAGDLAVRIRSVASAESAEGGVSLPVVALNNLVVEAASLARIVVVVTVAPRHST